MIIFPLGQMSLFLLNPVKILTSFHDVHARLNFVRKQLLHFGVRHDSMIESKYFKNYLGARLFEVWIIPLERRK